MTAPTPRGVREAHQELYGNASVSLEFAAHDLAPENAPFNLAKVRGFIREARESVNLACNALMRAMTPPTAPTAAEREGEAFGWFKTVDRTLADVAEIEAQTGMMEAYRVSPHFIAGVRLILDRIRELEAALLTARRGEEELASKIRFLLDHCNVSDTGVFTFPDGDTWDCALAARRENETLRATNLPAALLAAYRAKRSVDGFNGRTWDAVRHAEAEAEIERLERPPLPGPCDAPRPQSHAALFAQQSRTNRAKRMPKRDSSPQELERLEAYARATVQLVTLVTTLTEHWLYQVECDHEAKTDRAHCSCGQWSSEPQPSVGKAVEKWAVHVAALAATPEEK